MLKVGINGFGRIGRAVFRVNASQPRFTVVAINDLDPDVENLAYLLKYDSVYGRFGTEVTASRDDRMMMVDGHRIAAGQHDVHTDRLSIYRAKSLHAPDAVHDGVVDLEHGGHIRNPGGDGLAFFDRVADILPGNVNTEFFKPMGDSYDLSDLVSKLPRTFM